MRPEVTAAMAEAASHCVDMAELQAHASQVIAGVTGAEAGYVASGAAACLTLATAACVTGLEPGRMARLPDTTGMKNEVVVVRSQRNFYDHAVRAAGVRLVEVGLPDRYAGAGVRDAEGWEIADAITDRTAAVFYVADAAARPPLAEVVKVAHAAGVPVIVDAAAQLPPQANLRRFIEIGADLVAFSGGKALNGPQGTGILAGRRDLVMAAALQHLDLDIVWEQWSPPANADRQGPAQGRAPARHRPALQGRQGADHRPADRPRAVRRRRRRRAPPALARMMETLANGLQGVPGEVALHGIGSADEVPSVTLTLGRGSRLSALDLVIALQNGSPPIQADPLLCDRGIVAFNPMCLQPGEAEIVAAGVRRLLLS